MVMISMYHAGVWGSMWRSVDMLGSVSVNHSLTTPRCKNGTSECARPGFNFWEGRDVGQCLSKSQLHWTKV